MIYKQGVTYRFLYAVRHNHAREWRWGICNDALKIKEIIEFQSSLNYVSYNCGWKMII